MTNVSSEEISAVSGGTSCTGLWIGTKDMHWGVCLGEFQP